MDDGFQSGAVGYKSPSSDSFSSSGVNHATTMSTQYHLLADDSDGNKFPMQSAGDGDGEFREADFQQDEQPDRIAHAAMVSNCMSNALFH